MLGGAGSMKGEKLMIYKNITFKAAPFSYDLVFDDRITLVGGDSGRFINFEFSNQYMLFSRNCDGLNVSDKSFKILKVEGNRITLEEEL